MGTDKVIFVAEQWGATGSDVTGSYVTGSRVPGRGNFRNRKSVNAHAQPEVSQYTLVGPFHRK